MKEEAQRIAIAKAAGWSDIQIGHIANRINKVPLGRRKLDIGVSHHEEIPDYLHDLNAMHEAEKTLPKSMLTQDYWNVGYGRFSIILSEMSLTPYSATAAQRAEAFLRTLNLWKD